MVVCWASVSGYPCFCPWPMNRFLGTGRCVEPAEGEFHPQRGKSVSAVSWVATLLSLCSGLRGRAKRGTFEGKAKRAGGTAGSLVSDTVIPFNQTSCLDIIHAAPQQNLPAPGGLDKKSQTTLRPILQSVLLCIQQCVMNVGFDVCFKALGSKKKHAYISSGLLEADLNSNFCFSRPHVYWCAWQLVSGRDRRALSHPSGAARGEGRIAYQLEAAKKAANLLTFPPSQPLALRPMYAEAGSWLQYCVQYCILTCWQAATPHLSSS